MRCQTRLVPILSVLLLVVPVFSFGQDAAPPAVPAALEVVKAQGWWVQALGMDSVWDAVGSVLAFLFTWLLGTDVARKARGYVGEQKVEALQAGMIATYHEKVKALKAASRDGKITATEAENLRNAAIEAAKAHGGIIARTAITCAARPALDALLERLLGRMKRENSTPEGATITVNAAHPPMPVTA